MHDTHVRRRRRGILLINNIGLLLLLLLLMALLGHHLLVLPGVNELGIGIAVVERFQGFMARHGSEERDIHVFVELYLFWRFEDAFTAITERMLVLLVRIHLNRIISDSVLAKRIFSFLCGGLLLIKKQLRINNVILSRLFNHSVEFRILLSLLLWYGRLWDVDFCNNEWRGRSLALLVTRGRPFWWHGASP